MFVASFVTENIKFFNFYTSLNLQVWTKRDLLRIFQYVLTARLFSAQLALAFTLDPLGGRGHGASSSVSVALSTKEDMTSIHRSHGNVFLNLRHTVSPYFPDQRVINYNFNPCDIFDDMTSFTPIFRQPRIGTRNISGGLRSRFTEMKVQKTCALHFVTNWSLVRYPGKTLCTKM